MTDKFRNIKTSELNLASDGAVELSTELLDLVTGGISPEQAEEDEVEVANTGCTVNIGCKPK